MEGLEGFETLVDPAEQGADAFLQSLITTLDVHSPSRAVKEIFSYVWPGAVEGLNEGQEELTSSGTGVISRLLDAMRGSVGDTKEIGSGLMTSFNEGIGSQLSVSEQQGKANAEAAKEEQGLLTRPRPVVHLEDFRYSDRQFCREAVDKRKRTGRQCEAWSWIGESGKYWKIVRNSIFFCCRK